MKTYRFQDLSPQRIKELAAEFSDEEIRATFHEDEENFPFILGTEANDARALLWNAFNGPMITLHDDSVLAYAQADYLRRHNYPCFRTFDEIEAYAKEHNWPRKDRKTLDSQSK